MPEPYLTTPHIERCAKAFEFGYSTIDNHRAAGIMRELAANRDELEVALQNIVNGIETGLITSDADETFANALRQARAALNE